MQLKFEEFSGLGVTLRPFWLACKPQGIRVEICKQDSHRLLAEDGPEALLRRLPPRGAPAQPHVARAAKLYAISRRANHAELALDPIGDLPPIYESIRDIRIDTRLSVSGRLTGERKA